MTQNFPLFFVPAVVIFLLIGCENPPEGAHQWERHPEPLLTAGANAGAAKIEVAIADPDVFYDDQEGKWRMVYQGSRASTYTADDYEVQNVLAESEDGISWEVVERAIFGLPDDVNAWDGVTSETPSVAIDKSAAPERRYVMVYSGAGEIDPDLGFPRYQIGVAFSADGRSFTRLPAGESPHNQAGFLMQAKSVLNVPLMTGGVLADPEIVIEEDGTKHLLFSAYAHDAQFAPLAFGITYATAPPGSWDFTLPTGVPLEGLLPDGGAGGQQPSVVFNDVTEEWEMVYTSDEDHERGAMPSTFNPSMGVWRATSLDLQTWAVQDGARDFVWDPEGPHEKLGLLTGAALVVNEGKRRLYYTGWGDQNVPEGFLVPVHTGLASGVLHLLLATREAN